MLSDGDQWVVEAEWPDGTLESVNTFKDHASAAYWISARSETWDGGLWHTGACGSIQPRAGAATRPSTGGLLLLIRRC